MEDRLPHLRGGPVLKEPKTARDRVWAFAFALQVLGAVGVMIQSVSVRGRLTNCRMCVSCCHGFVSFPERRRYWKWTERLTRSSTDLSSPPVALLCGLRVGEDPFYTVGSIMRDLRRSWPLLCTCRRAKL